MEKIYLTPGPVRLPPVVIRSLGRDIVSHRSEEFHKIYASIKERLRKVFKTSGEVVVINASGTGGVEAALLTLINSKDRVLVPIYGEFCRRGADILERAGKNVKRSRIEIGRVPSVEDIKKELEDGKYNYIFLIHNETSTGVVLRNLSEISHICKEKGVRVIVDSVSGLCGEYLDMEKWNVDVCISASQKCVAGPPGLSFIALSQEIEEIIERRKNISPSTYLDLYKILQYSKKNETPFTSAIHLFYGLKAALEILEEERLDRRIRRHKINADTLRALFHMIEIEGYSKDVVFSSNTVIVGKLGDKYADLRRRLMNEYGIVVAGKIGMIKDNIVRVGNMGIVGPYEIEKFSRAIGSISEKEESSRRIYEEYLKEFQKLYEGFDLLSELFGEV